MSTIQQLMRDTLALRASMQKVASYVSDMQRAFDVVSPVLDHVAEWAAIANRFEDREKTVQALKGHGVCLAPSMPRDLADEIIRKAKAAKPPGPKLLGFYRRNGWAALIEIVERWESNRFFRRRMHIFRDALWAHVNGRYTLSVAALTPQVEGLVWDWIFVFTKGDSEAISKVIKREGSGRFDGYVVQRTIGQLAANIFTEREWLSILTLVEFANAYLYRRYRSQREHTRFLSESALARHAALHGSGLRSGTALNSLRLFLALDVLALVQ